MTRKRLIILIFLLIFLVGCGALAIKVRNHGFSAREQPSWLEAALARRARRIATPAEAVELKNPHPVTESSMAEAREHFVAHCSICHGGTGRGDTLIGRNVYPKVPDMSKTVTQELTDGELYYIITNGVRFTAMPAFGDEDSPKSIWDLVSFIRRLPQLTPEEMKQLEELAGTSEGAEQEKAAQPENKEAEKKAKPKQHNHSHGAKPHRH
ncbi:MAG: c-type cytochrome [Acidobacteria bacterium]|nr:c-type cytochrome [Acidobacteriota bacterium]